MINPKRVLVLSPHTDDSEFGCGGTISYFRSKGIAVHVVAFSICEESVPQGFAKDALQYEFEAAAKALQIDSDAAITRRYPVRKFSYHRQEILEDLVKLRKEIEPDTVFMPSSMAIHQDHKVIHEEGLRAFKFLNCLGYELPWDQLELKGNFLIALDQIHVDLKVKALQCYKTQSFRHYMSQEFIEGWAMTRGVQAASKYAEAFEVYKLISADHGE